MSNKIRVRFAPSPTGYLHIGGLRTALYNYFFARKNEGVFVLRIEDTDRTRHVPGATEALIEVLNKIGLNYDEGPYLCSQTNKEISNSQFSISKADICEKGEFGPYVQSKRLDLYKKYALDLVKRGKAYYCFCSTQTIEEMRQKQIVLKMPTMYGGRCKELTKDEILNNLNNGAPYVIRLKVPKNGKTAVNDLIRGEVSFENKLIDDQVLLKSDGFPTYHLANVVDDHLMEISHVLRADEWLPSTPKHVLLYKAFGWKVPQFAHLPLLLNADKSKLSKRQGDVAVEDYLSKGYLPEALLNFVALLGWNPSDKEEIYSLNELAEKFDLKKINKAGAVFNLEKLNWLNGEYLREKSDDELLELCRPYLPKNFTEDYLKKVVGIEKNRLQKLSDITFLTEFFFKDKLDYDSQILIWKKSTQKDTKGVLEKLFEFLEKLPEDDFTAAILEEKIRDFIEKHNFGVGDTLWPMRAALSGREASPSPFEIAEVLGKNKTLLRIKEAINKVINKLEA